MIITSSLLPPPTWHLSIKGHFNRLTSKNCPEQIVKKTRNTTIMQISWGITLHYQQNMLDGN